MLTMYLLFFTEILWVFATNLITQKLLTAGVTISMGLAAFNGGGTDVYFTTRASAFLYIARGLLS